MAAARSTALMRSSRTVLARSVQRIEFWRSAKLRAIAALLCVAALCVSRTSPAQSSSAQARTLFREARALMDKERYEEACPKLEESLRLDHGIGTQFNLAHCWEKIGRPVSAWGMFLEVAAGARKENQKKRERAANERAAALEPLLPRMRIEVSEPAPGITVLRAGEEVGSAAWGTPMPLDPGTYRIEASAPDKEPWSKEIEVLAGGETIAVEIPPLVDIRKPEPVVVATAPTEPERDAPVESAGSGRKAFAWALAGVGVVGAGTGVFFGLRSKKETEAAQNLCNGGENGNTCNRDQGSPTFDGGTQERSEVYSHRNQAKTAAVASYVAFGVGGAALIGSILLAITGSDDSEPEAALHVQPLVGREEQGVVLSGSF